MSTIEPFATTDPPAPTGCTPEGLPHPDIPVVGPITGAFTWDVTADQWSWSEEMYVIHGFQPHEVVPTTALILSHKHPEDLRRCRGVMTHALEQPGRFSCYHRIIDNHTRIRHVITAGETRIDADGRVVEVSGFMVDLTDARRNDLEPTVQEAVAGAVQHRSDIDLAKGAIMQACGTTQDGAFEILRSASQTSNRKVRDLARQLVAELSREPGEPGSSTLMSEILSLAPPDLSARPDRPT